MAKKICLVQDRFDFPQLLIPVFQKVSYIGEKPDVKNPPYDLYLSLDAKIGIDGINVDWRENGEFYWGGTNVYSEKVGYNRIIGIDDTELYLTSDSYNDFYDEDNCVTVADSGSLMTKWSDVQVIKSIDRNIEKRGYGEFVIKMDDIFEKGNKLISKYPFRKGNFVRGYGARNIIGPSFIGIILMIPAKRDIDAVLIKVFNSESKQDLELKMRMFECAVDPTSTKYLSKYISNFVIENEVATVGFLVSSSHLTLFDYDLKCAISGMSIHDKEE